MLDEEAGRLLHRLDSMIANVVGQEGKGGPAMKTLEEFVGTCCSWQKVFGCRRGVVPALSGVIAMEDEVGNAELILVFVTLFRRGTALATRGRALATALLPVYPSGIQQVSIHDVTRAPQTNPEGTLL